MPVYGIDKQTKEHREVYRTDETYSGGQILSRADNGSVVCLNGHLRVFISDLMTTESVPAYTDKTVSYALPAGLNGFYTHSGTTTEWTTGRRTIVLTDLFPDMQSELEFTEMAACFRQIGYSTTNEQSFISFNVNNQTNEAKQFKFKYIVIQIG